MTNTLAVAQQGEAILTLIAIPVTQAEFDSDWLRQFNSALMETMQQRQAWALQHRRFMSLNALLLSHHGPIYVIQTRRIWKL